MSAFNLSALAVRERSVTLFLLVAIFVAGVVAFLTLGRAEDPSFTIKQVTVVTAWPGATAKEMEELVAERLEKRMQELRWYDRTETFTRPGLAFTTVFLRDSTPPADVPEQFYQARKKLGDEARQLPPGVIGPMVNDEYADVTFALYALKARGESHRRLVRDAETLRQPGTVDQEREDHRLAEQQHGIVAGDRIRVTRRAGDVFELVIVAKPDLAQPGSIRAALLELLEAVEAQARRTPIGPARRIDEFLLRQLADRGSELHVPDRRADPRRRLP